MVIYYLTFKYKAILSYNLNVCIRILVKNDRNIIIYNNYNKLCIQIECLNNYFVS